MQEIGMVPSCMVLIRCSGQGNERLVSACKVRVRVAPTKLLLRKELSLVMHHAARGDLCKCIED